MERHAADPLAGLLDRFLATGDEKAMEELVRLTRPRLHAAARRMAGAADAEDAVQTAYHALLRKGEVPRDAPLMAWLLTAVVRVAYRHRATTRAQHEIARRLASAPRPAPSVPEDEALLRAEIEHLPALYRDAVVLHYFEGLTAAEAGQLLGLGEAAVWQRLRRARLLLRSRLSPRLKHGLLLIPWWLADRATAASLLVGGTMKGKAAAAVLVLALAGGGIAWHESRGVTTAERSPDLPARIVAEDVAPAPAEANADLGPPTRVARDERPPQTVSQELTDHLRDEGSSGLRVRVVDENGLAWRGAKTWLSEFTLGGAARPIERETDAAGIVDLDGSRPGTWHLSTAVGGVWRSAKVELVGGRRTDAKVVIPREGVSLEGTVRDRASGPLPGATLRLECRGASFSTVVTAKTDAEGGYRIAVVPPGSYRVAVEAPMLGRGARHCGELDVAGDARIRRDFEIGVPSLMGVVRDATTGLAIPDFPVRLQDPVSALCDTDAEGAYRFYDLPTGRGRLVLARDGHEMLFVDPGQLVLGETRTLDIALHPAAVLHLYVSDESGLPVTDKFSLRMCNYADPSLATASSQLTADSDGHAVFRMIRPGRYDLSIERRGVESASQDFEIRAGENTARFQLQPQLSLPMLRGIVRDAATGLPMPGVRVAAMLAATSSSQGTCLTDEDGSFEFERLTAGEQDLWVSKDGYAFRKVRTEKLERGRTCRVDVALDVGATLKLSILNQQGEPPQKPVFLNLTPRDGPESNTWSTELEIDESGHAAYRSVPPGRYKLIVVSMDGSVKVEVDVPATGASLAVRLR